MNFLFIIVLFFSVFARDLPHVETTHVYAYPIYISVDEIGGDGKASSAQDLVHAGLIPPSFIANIVNGSNKTEQHIRESIQEQEQKVMTYGQDYRALVNNIIHKRDRAHRLHRVFSALSTSAKPIVMHNIPEQVDKSFNWDDFRYYSHLKEEAYEARKMQLVDNYQKKNYDDLILDTEKLYYSDRHDSSIEFISNDGLFLPEKLDSNIPTSPFSAKGFKTSPDNRNGQALRRVANGYQIAWAAYQGQLREKSGFGLAYVQGLAYLRLADETFSSNEILALKYLKYAKEVSSQIFDFIGYVSDGIIKQAKDTVDMAPEALKLLAKTLHAKNNPNYMLDCIYAMVETSPKLAAEVWELIGQQYEVITNGSSRQRGELVGALVFEGLATYATMGASRVISSSRAASNLSLKALNNISSNFGARARLSYNKFYKDNIDEFAATTNALNTVNPKRLNKGLEVYKSLKLSGNQRLADEALQVSTHIMAKDEKYFEPLYKVATSQIDGNNRSRYFNSLDDIKEIEKAVDLAENIVAMPKKSVSGYRTRIVAKERVQFIDDAVNFHDGSKASKGRFALGGPNGVEVLSFGFGTTKDASFESAKKEIISYLNVDTPFDINNYKVVSQKVELNNVLDLRNLKGEEAKRILDDRLAPDSYLLPNIIGTMAKANKVDYILSKSAVGTNNNFNIHWIKND